MLDAEALPQDFKYTVGIVKYLLGAAEGRLKVRVLDLRDFNRIF